MASLDDMRAVFTEHWTAETATAFLDTLRDQMLLHRRYAEVSGANFMTIRWTGGLSISYEDGKVTATCPGLMEAVGEVAAADGRKPAVTVQQVEAGIAGLDLQGRNQ